MPRKSVNKVANNISDDGLLSKNRSWLDDGQMNTPTRPEWRKRLIKTMYAWAEKQTSLEIMQFCIEYKLPRNRFYDWAARYPEIKDALNDMRLMISSNRKVGSMTKALDGNYAYRDMHMLDPDWHAINKYHADLKKEEEKAAHTFIINTDKPKVVSKEEMKENNDRQSS